MHLRLASLGAFPGAFLVLFSVVANPAIAAKKAEKPAKQSEPVGQDTSLNNLKDAPKAPSLACTGPFAADTTHAKLMAEFGARNVVFKDVVTASDVKTQATVVFDDDPTRRLVVYWKDNKTRAKPASISIEAPSTWTGPGDVRNGLTLKDLERLNGGGFSIKGFGSIGGGEIADLKGQFADVPGDCSLKIKLEPGIANPLPPRFASVTGDQLIPSKNLVLRRVRPQVSQWSVNYR